MYLPWRLAASKAHQAEVGGIFRRRVNCLRVNKERVYVSLWGYIDNSNRTIADSCGVLIASPTRPR